MTVPQEKQNFTYEDYIKLTDDMRYEAIDGQIYNMTPSPTPNHQGILGELFIEFGSYLRGKQCRAFISPIDVCFSDEKEDLGQIKEWVIPDLVVVCDKNKIGDKRIMGTPDLLIEVLSPSTAKHDRLTKYNRYQRAGVKEYWIVDPVHKTIEVYFLEGEGYKRKGIYSRGDILPVSIFEDFSLDLDIVFRNDEE
ncbi:Uma2 family endonuclease [Ammoniphilus sp. YIM 78166]|uniref:Uma2 family endonuclease n=1 Tax=Ammoniphilus sp. YIM 78166 TaxID=1644106 RepID=UPI00106F8E17|nr:Uma2 family endonuclease [Ammoniphilus sp. YIM 78166]